ncbi:uncharacterized protein LOC113749322 [Coffea eugenioides]|uniref:uncharacterized protein LOC113749322 n=1 Tax=Coffea eugenioides TaxID=49369 RepID=UPI000F605C7E|nr:uncharacterized protein LOC113749322 [Coffea eugenioides]
MLDPRTESDDNPHQAFDPFRSINDRNGSGSWRSGSFGARARKTGGNYQNYWNLNGDGVQFRPQNSEDESGVQSPPLWKSSPPTSPLNSRCNSNTYRSLSPTSRTQAIARGQRELMEMVKNMPESCYELSLKDLVEHPRIESPKEESYLLEQKNYDDRLQVLNQKVKSIRRQESKNSEKKAQILRSKSMENRDLFLKMVFPLSFKSRKKKNLMTNTLAKVSPKPEVPDKTSKSVDKDWWKKRFSSSSGSESGRTSSNGGSTGSSGSSSSSSRSNSGRKRSGFLTSCFSCFYSTKGKSPK